jgi:transcriptional regulator with XRE-family HTH domain
MAVKKKTNQLIDSLASNVRTFRKAKGWSLQRLIEESGVSKRMLTLIEKGEANPSVKTIDRIAQGLGVSFGELLSVSEGSQVQVFTSSDFVLKKIDQKGSRTRVLTTLAPRPLELWEWTLAAGASHTATPDRPGSQAILLVLAGELSLETENETHLIRKGSAARFASDQPYSFYAPAKKKVHFVTSFQISRES